jgi:hypothetical protein
MGTIKIICVMLFVVGVLTYLMKSIYDSITNKEK